MEIFKSNMAFRKPIKIGTRFSDLVILKELQKRAHNGTIQYLCQCDCGNITIAYSTCLRAGKHKSCGCRRHLPHHALPAGIAGFNALFKAYQHQAKQREYKFNLTKQQFQELTSSNCFYCGIKPIQEKRSRADSKSEPYFYNGIDRINNTKGYIIENCIACCGICNRMKQNLSQEDFLKHISKIKKYHDSRF